MSGISSFLEILSQFCCCSRTSTTDRERLLNTEYREDSRNISNTNGGTAFASGLRTGVPDRNLPIQNRSREEEEEDLMNRILDRTQQRIIDVTNLENNSLDIDMIQRSRLYAEAIKRHDALTDRRRGLESEESNKCLPLKLLTDNGSRASEFMASSHPNLMVNVSTQEELDLLNHTMELFIEAHRIGAQIECKEELIVYMSLDD